MSPCPNANLCAASRNIRYAVRTEKAVPDSNANITHAIRMVQVEEEMARFQGVSLLNCACQVSISDLYLTVVQLHRI